jgi:hypothetical protein
VDRPGRACSGIHPELRPWHNRACESPMRAQEISGPISSQELDVLDKYLRSERAPPRCMWISQLDGFLTGVAAGPERVPVSEWLPLIWGGAEPTFRNAAVAHKGRNGAPIALTPQTSQRRPDHKSRRHVARRTAHSAINVS